ncbi:predicted protein [Plenodomus lingam JN3]|uniref:Predicted protein n=1 Tax=Leptosphaeria maculans (strain JN3 / isolate v23.1.3 / race Av1-4-5-6-7-8) TaxID=985895 RepID=E4ZZZ4_LEPMJ|nr:predicted protein [Plenodomus lingam JN3]CBX96854.1 predicted protein [Plenodomus lingam JN3]
MAPANLCIVVPSCLSCLSAQRQRVTVGHTAHHRQARPLLMDPSAATAPPMLRCHAPASLTMCPQWCSSPLLLEGCLRASADYHLTPLFERVSSRAPIWPATYPSNNIKRPQFSRFHPTVPPHRSCVFILDTSTN